MWLLIDLGSFKETHPVHRELVEAAEIYSGQWSTAEALQVAYCESRWNLEAVSGTKDHGAWQIHKPTWFDSGACGPRVWGRRYTALGSASLAIEVQVRQTNLWRRLDFVGVPVMLALRNAIR